MKRNEILIQATPQTGLKKITFNERRQTKCPMTGEWIKKMWYIYTMEYYSILKNNGIMPFAATWVSKEIIIPKGSKSQRERQISCDVTYIIQCGIQKRYKSTNLQNINKLTQKINLGLQKGKGRGGINYEFGHNIYILLYIKQINKELLYSTDNSTQYSVIIYMEK